MDLTSQGVAEATGMMISGKAGFDSQAGQFKAFGTADFVPMHQAKVLDRSDRLKEDEAALRKLTGERWPWRLALWAYFLCSVRAGSFLAFTGHRP